MKEIHEATDYCFWTNGSYTADVKGISMKTEYVGSVSIVPTTSYTRYKKLHVQIPFAVWNPSHSLYQW